MTAGSGASIESRRDYKDTPTGKYSYWSDELDSAQKTTRNWHKQADRIVQRYLGQVQSRGDGEISTGVHNPTLLNLFHSNVKTLESMLYGNVPTIDVSRRYAQADDDEGRIAAEIMERLLNLDVQASPDTIECILKSTLQDRLTAGLGCARVRYTVGDSPTDEDVPIDYYFWSDVLWGWSRDWAGVPWIAFRNYMTKDEIKKRWGEKAANNVVLKQQRATGSEEEDSPDTESNGPWMKAEVWEIWDKQSRTVKFVTIGYERILEEVEDPLKLDNFFPTPPFLVANPTTKLYIPTPDFTLAQDLYNEVDTLQSRISIITEAVKVVGVYDGSAGEVNRMFNEGVENQVIPVDNWALFGEKGGLQGVIDWFPIEDVVAALERLRGLRDETIVLLQQVTGMADVMQGSLNNQYEGVGQSQIKAKFGSSRIQSLQDQFAQFASGLMQLKAEIISKHFEPQTIFQRANMTYSKDDPEQIMRAIELIKKPKEARLRVVIRPESVAMIDYAELKNERTEYLTAISTFMQSAGALMDQDPTAKPFLLQLLQWGLAGFKGSSEIEGVIDKAIETSEKAQQENQGQPSPEEQAMQQQQQMAMQLEQAKVEGQLAVVQAKSQSDQALREQDRQADIDTEMARHQTKMAELQANNAAKMAEIEAKLLSDIRLEEIQSGINAQQHAAQVGNEMQKDQANTQLEIQKEATKTSLKIQEMAASTAGKIKEAQAKPAPSTGGED